MRVAMYYSNRDVRLEQAPAPRPGPGEALLRVRASGICGSDLMEWYRKDKAPLVLGHEVTGEIEQVGEGVASLRPGDRVVASHHVPCNTCAHCLRGNHTVCETLRRTRFDPGGFAELLRLEGIHVDRGVLRLPDEVSYEEGTFTEPLGCVLRAQRRAGVEPGSAVLVVGSGVAGLLHVQAARALGASPVVAVDVLESRLEAARRLGADAAFLAGEDVHGRLRALTGGRLADQVVVCAGAAAAAERALKCVERGGTVILFAPTEPGATIPVSVNDVFFRNDVTVTTSYAAAPSDLAAALEMIRSRRVRVAEMITHRLGLAETGRGFALLASGQAIKVIVDPQR